MKKSFIGCLALLVWVPGARGQDRITQLQAQREEQRAALAATEAELHRLLGPGPLPEPPKDNPSIPQAEKAKPDLSFLRVRQSIKDKNRSDLPATFQYTNAGNAKNSKAFDVAVALDLLSAPLGIDKWLDKSKHELLFAGEYHYNSAKDAKQDTEMLGLNGDFSLGKTGGLEHRMIVEAGYKADRRLTGEGFQGEISYYPYSRDLALWSERQGCIGSYQFEYQFLPEIGVEYEKGDGELKPFREGDRQSFKASMGVALYPWKNLEWTTSVNYWRHFGTDGVYNLFHDDQVYVQSSMVYYLNEGRNFGVGVDYLHGDHPTEGKYDVDAWQFGVKMKF